VRRLDRPATQAVILAVILCVPVTRATAAAPFTDIITRPGAEGAADKQALEAAVALLPQAPRRVAVIDVRRNSPRVREHLLTLDAFTVKGNGVIYVVEQSALLQGARAGSGIYRAMLATVLWHEMAHLRGADEQEARRVEEELCRRFIREGRIDALTGLRYLHALVRRTDDQLLAVR
jgi:hypothetical protein